MTVDEKELIDAGLFLMDRLNEFEREIGGGEEEREWAGHVHPAMSRLNTLLLAYLSARSAEPVAAEARTAPIPVAVVLAAEAKLRAHPTPEASDV